MTQAVTKDDGGTRLETGLSVRLREATAHAHETAEHSPFMEDLLSGRSGPEAFVALTGQLRHVYAALESACRAHADDPRLAPLLDTRLERLGRLDADLAALGRQCPVALSATRDYVERVGACDPVRLVAHHYTRYLGDLSGGQVIPTMLRRHYGLDEGMTFYRFESVGKVKPYKDAYRDALDALPLTEAETGALVDEAVDAFGLNSALFAQLEAERRGA